jgi:peptidoglycan hydrolase-like protein with peptidoglycan-binding domain
MFAPLRPAPGRAAQKVVRRKPAGKPASTNASKPFEGLQAKLKVGGAHDPLERAADRAADQVMRTRTPATGLFGTAGSAIQRQLASPLEGSSESTNLCATPQQKPSPESFATDPTLVSVRARLQLLRRGSRSKGVRLVQQALRSFGCERLGMDLLPRFGADGDFGGETDDAVRTFQDSNGLAADGLVGPETLGTLDVFVAGGPEPTPGENDSDVPDTVENSRGMEVANVSPKLLPGKGLPAPGPSAHHALTDTGGGRPLDAGVRGRMEAGFARDFSGVRIHVGSASEQAASELNARAFTAGRDIWFGKNEFAPGTPTGERLLAHELAHVVQQSGSTGSASSVIQRAICPKKCVTPVAKGQLCTSTKHLRDNCKSRGAADSQNRITHIRIFTTSSKVELFFNGEPGKPKGKKETHPCTLNATETSKPFKGGKCLLVGQKCGEGHTTWPKKGSGKIFNMAFFTEFRGPTPMRYGFHDSQRVAPGAQSSGCVRVSCEIAKRINNNTSSGVTTIELVGVSQCAPKKKKPSGGSGGR